MTGVRVRWVPTLTDFPEGTPPTTHYVVHLGALDAQEPVGSSAHDFLNVPAGDHPMSVDTMAGATVLATHNGAPFHVPQPVSTPVAMNVTGELLP